MKKTCLLPLAVPLLSILCFPGNSSAAQDTNAVPAIASVAGAYASATCPPAGYKIASDGGGDYVDRFQNVGCSFFRSSKDFVLDTANARVLRRLSVSLMGTGDCLAAPLCELPLPSSAPTYNLFERVWLLVGGIFDMHPGEVRAAPAEFQISAGKLLWGQYPGRPTDWCTNWISVSASYDTAIQAAGPGGANTWVISTTPGTATSWTGSEATGDIAVLRQTQQGRDVNAGYYHLPWQITARLK